MIDYLCFPGSNIIYQVQLNFPYNFSEQQMDDPEFITNHIRDYLEEDALMKEPKRIGPKCFEYYSPKKDFNKTKVISMARNKLAKGRVF